MPGAERENAAAEGAEGPPSAPGARWFEDWSVGDEVTTQGRTLTEADHATWCGFTGDLNPIHVDEEFARRYSPFGTRIPQGLILVAMASGLMERLGVFGGTGRGFAGQTIRFRRPVHIGDTISVVLRVTRLDDRPDRPYGRVDFAYEIRKADGTTCVEGEMETLVANRGA